MLKSLETKPQKLNFSSAFIAVDTLIRTLKLKNIDKYFEKTYNERNNDWKNMVLKKVSGCVIKDLFKKADRTGVKQFLVSREFSRLLTPHFLGALADIPDIRFSVLWFNNKKKKKRSPTKSREI